MSVTTRDAYDEAPLIHSHLFAGLNYALQSSSQLNQQSGPLSDHLPMIIYFKEKSHRIPCCDLELDGPEVLRNEKI